MLGVHDPCGGGGGGGLTSQAGDGLHDPEWGPTPRGDPCPGGVAKTDPAPRRKRGVAWPARSWGLPGGGRGLGGGGVATDAIRGAWSPPPPRRRRRARRTVRVWGGVRPHTSLYRWGADDKGFLAQAVPPNSATKGRVGTFPTKSSHLPKTRV